MIRTRSKPVCKTHFNLSAKQIRKYRQYIRKLTNRKWMASPRKPSTPPKISFAKNQVHEFKQGRMRNLKVVPLNRKPIKGILKS